MVRPVKRRHSSVLHTKHLIDAIKAIRYQKQIPNIERIARYMNREHGLRQTETEKHLHYAVKDGVILSYMAVGKKGSMTGIEQEGFRLPEEDEDLKGDHDWYCFECHAAGEVLPCSDCWRVFHPSCTMEEWTGPKFTCTICQEIKAGRQQRVIKRKMLNTLLSYTILRMKEKTRELHRIGHREEEKKYQSYFIYSPMDLNKIEQKVENHKYRSLEEFLADTQLIYHNVYLLYGDEIKGGMTELAKIMARDSKYDVEEIKQCQNCYYMSNAKPKDWFCQPCDPPHQLVYAKVKGFCYWPAKVIRTVADKFDVRFFGSPHQRALLPKESLKPIDTPLKSLSVKRTQGFNKSMEELEKHKKLLKEKSYEMEEEDDDDDDSLSRSDAASEDKMSRNEEEEEEEEEQESHMDTSPLEVSSTSVSPPKKRMRIKAPTPEDANVVTSSEDKINTVFVPKVVTANIACQTVEKTTETKNKGSQTDALEEPKPTKEEDSEPASSIIQSEEMDREGEESKSQSSASHATMIKNLEEKHERKMSDLRMELENDYEESKQKALKELSDRLQKDFEEDKQQAVSRAMSNNQREIDRAKQQTEDKCKKEYMEEMKKLAAKHKEAISQTKKKQWCFNCEEEAMYHCCWNTSYCSVKCQQEHWHKEHKRVCRRKR